MVEDRIRLSIEDGVADVRLNRADKMNALDPSMFKALADTAAHLKQHTSVRAVVLSGEGNAFCAGLDLKSITALTDGEIFCPLLISPNGLTALPILSSTLFGLGESWRSR